MNKDNIKTNLINKNKIIKISILIIIFIFIISALIVNHYKYTLFQEGNPVKYLKVFIQLTINKDHVEIPNINLSDSVSKTFITKTKDNDKFINYIEETYNVKFVEQMGSGYSFRGDNIALPVETKTYMKFYTIWELGKIVHF